MEYKSIFKTDKMKEMNEAYATYYFPEYQTMAMMIVENEKKVEFHGFQVALEIDPLLGEVLSYTIDYTREDEKLPLIKVIGFQKTATKEPLKITLDYLTSDGTLIEKYVLFEDGDYFFQ